MARKQAGAHAKSPVELCFAARVRDTCMRTCVSTCQCTPGDVHMRVLQQHGARLGHRLGGGENVVALECKQRGAHTRTDRPGTAAAPPHASTHMHDDSHHDCCMSSRSCQVITIHTDVRPSVLYQACQTVRCASYRARAQAPTRLRWCCRRAIGAPAIASRALLGPDHVSRMFSAKRDIVRTASYRMLRSAAPPGHRTLWRTHERRRQWAEQGTPFGSPSRGSTARHSPCRSRSVPHA
jgi:hypothetical protein